MPCPPLHILGAQTAKLSALTSSGHSFVLWSFTKSKPLLKLRTTSANRVFQQVCPNRIPFLAFSLLRRDAFVLRIVLRGLPSAPGASARGSRSLGRGRRWRSGVSGTATPGRCGRWGGTRCCRAEGALREEGALWRESRARSGVFFRPSPFSSPPPWSPAVLRSCRPKEAKAKRKC